MKLTERKDLLKVILVRIDKACKKVNTRKGCFGVDTVKEGGR